MKTFLEKTSDRGWTMKVQASDNQATYILTSARMHDKVSSYKEKWGKNPTSRWYRKYTNFEEITKV